MVFNLMRLPRMFPQFDFDMHYFRRPQEHPEAAAAGRGGNRPGHSRFLAGLKPGLDSRTARPGRTPAPPLSQFQVHHELYRPHRLRLQNRRRGSEISSHLSGISGKILMIEAQLPPIKPGIFQVILNGAAAE